jgi:hypothetical protein
MKKQKLLGLFPEQSQINGAFGEHALQLYFLFARLACGHFNRPSENCWLGDFTSSLTLTRQKGVIYG